MGYLQILVLAAVLVAVLAQDKCDPADCPACDHGVPFCDHHDACHCKDHAKRATSAQVCSSASDCTSWGDANCSHGQKASCEMIHGSGQGGGEYNCVCKAHKRATTGCCTANDCDATALGCAHNEMATCELQHGSGQGCGENMCKCVSKH